MDIIIKEKPSLKWWRKPFPRLVVLTAASNLQVYLALSLVNDDEFIGVHLHGLKTLHPPKQHATFTTDKFEEYFGEITLSND